MSPRIIQLSPRSITVILSLVAAGLVSLSTIGQFIAYFTGHNNLYGLIPLFFVDAELNIPTFFSSLLLLIASQLLLTIWVLERRKPRAHAIMWLVLSVGFLLMAADEALSLHEALMVPTRQVFGEGIYHTFHFPWIVPATFLVMILIPFFLKFLMRLERSTRTVFLIAGVIYLTGAIGFEYLGGLYAEHHGIQNLTYSMIATVEESLEMTGVIVFIWALLRHMQDAYRQVAFLIGRPSEDGT